MPGLNWKNVTVEAITQAYLQGSKTINVDATGYMEDGAGEKFQISNCF